MPVLDIGFQRNPLLEILSVGKTAVGGGRLVLEGAKQEKRCL